MRRFLFKIPARFKGAVEAHYNTNGTLLKLDFSSVELTPEVIKWFKNRMAVLVENVEVNFADTGVIVTEAEFEVTFQDFRREYPYKRNTHLAEAYWPRLTSSNQYQAFIQAMEYGKYCKKEEKWYKPMMADKWLKTEQFKNNWKEL